MKKGIHPEYREVVFQDPSADFAFLTRSTIKTNETIKWEDGNEYPLVRVEISSASHPFYTGKQKFVDTAGRVEKFQKRHSWDNSTVGRSSREGGAQEEATQGREGDRWPPQDEEEEERRRRRRGP